MCSWQEAFICIKGKNHCHAAAGHPWCCYAPAELLTHWQHTCNSIKNQNWFHSTTTHRTSTDDIYIYGKQTLYDGVIESSNRKVGSPKKICKHIYEIAEEKTPQQHNNESGHKPHECCCSQGVRTLNPKPFLIAVTNLPCLPHWLHQFLVMAVGGVDKYIYNSLPTILGEHITQPNCTTELLLHFWNQQEEEENSVMMLP